MKMMMMIMRMMMMMILYIVRPNDRVYCELSGINDYPEGQYMSQRVQFHSLLSDTKEVTKEVTDPLTELTAEQRLELLLWLDIHHNTWASFR